jgi:DNA repair exonuclease SbcCD ATPase subunit
MLERLELNNFKKHEHLVLDFTAGLNGVTGPNYRGKTTVLYGILYCLGGARLVPGSRLQTRGTNAGFKQSLWLSFGNIGRYRIERTKTGATLTELCTDGTEQPVATGTTPVNQAIARLLGMPLKRFAQIKYAKQRKASALLEVGSTELFKIITELTGLERVTLVLEKVSGQLKAWKLLQDESPLTDIDAQQVQVMNWLGEEIQLSGDLLQLNNELTEATHQRGISEDHERRLSQAQTAVFGAVTTLRQAEREATASTAALEEAQQQLTQFRGHPLTTEGLFDLELQLKDLRELAMSTKQARNQVKQVQLDLESAQQELQAAVRKAAPLRDDLKALRREGGVDLEALREAAAQAEANKQAAGDRLEALIEAGKNGVCVGCKRPFDAFNPHDHAEQVREHQETWRQKLGAAQLVRDALQAETNYRQNLAQAEDALRQAENAVHLHQVTCNRLSDQLDQATRDSLTLPPTESLAPQIEALEAQISTGRQDAHRQANLRQALAVAEGNATQRNQWLTNAKNDLHQTEIQHQVVGVDLPTALRTHREKVEQFDSQIRRLQEQIGVLSNLRHGLHEQRIALERTLATVVERNRQHEQAAQKVGLLTELLGHIRSNRDRYSKQVWDVFMASASMFASNATGGVIESISRGEDGAFTFVEDGFEMEQAEASGAQLAIIGTAVQLALDAAALSPLNLVLMDEPTADMDPERALAFSTLLAGSGKQVVMVTHREMDGAVFDNTLEI